MSKKPKLFRSGPNLSPKKPLRTHFNTSYILILFGLLLVAASLFWQYYQARVLSFSESKIEESLETIPIASPTQLSIPDLGINLSITQTTIVDGVWEISDSSASHLKNSSNPGANGNIIIYGHNKKELLGNLKKAKIGQPISITTSDSRIHSYQIQEILTVNSDQVEVIQPTATEILTIYTCTGFLDSKRLVIRAIPAP